jgi:hypothetical protein
MVLTVVVDIVIAEHHIDILAVLVLDKEVCQSRAIGDELRRSATYRSSRTDDLTCALMPGAEIVYRPSSSGPGASHPGPIAAASATAATKSSESLIFTWTDPVMSKKQEHKSNQQPQSSTPPSSPRSYGWPFITPWLSPHTNCVPGLTPLPGSFGLPIPRIQPQIEANQQAVSVGFGIRPWQSGEDGR